mmetsp:Transcript_17504/g.29382  ORF Transcript_17504/g.29382 Transcript_17504/m.29382 type:complete len:250 (+) Transcript_17504:233-982(+)|eukprot:CAMPEP_0198197562 /NCGR_PEP_ID=MMETSP1445-20131203/1135_1 /TAXON_ID=36898 /ORGANISM="Pyramimonas sp., Strain CCMP2087" /LENGTH=249 /DNA_ID=CAMNT_0043866875 /DNA_START=221 /DNA_END=970 /DNA_ORIENTATION=+
MADRGRRAMPVGNRLCQEKWVERCQNLHRDRLRNMRSTASDPRVTTLDNSTPASMSMPHLQLKQKKAQLEEERFAQIELENRILLEKMSKIMRQDPGDARSSHGGHHTEQFPFRSTLQLKPGIRCDMTQYPMLDSRNFIAPKSMNRESRLRELKKITSENQSMLRRIQNREPYYDHTKWEEERVRDLQYLKNIRSREVMALSKTFSRSASVPPRSRASHTFENPNAARASKEEGDAPDEEPEADEPSEI